MKQLTVLVAAALAFGAAAMPPVQKISVPAGSHHPVLSPDGTTLLFSTDIHTGLSAMDLGSGEIRVLDRSAGAGFQPVFSQDGKTVYYRSATVRDGLMMRDVRSCKVDAAAAPAVLRQASRDNVNLTALTGGDYAVADYRSIRVRRNGTETSIDPIADSHSYLWASLSPAGDKLLFTEPFEGVFVSKPDGSEPVRLLAKGDFASWAGDNRFVAVITHDDGYVVLDSKLVLVNVATGIVTDLTPEGFLVGEATASASGKVVYTDIEGNMYMIDVNEL